MGVAVSMLITASSKYLFVPLVSCLVPPPRGCYPRGAFVAPEPLLVAGPVVAQSCINSLVLHSLQMFFFFFPSDPCVTVFNVGTVSIAHGEFSNFIYEGVLRYSSCLIWQAGVGDGGLRSPTPHG